MTVESGTALSPAGFAYVADLVRRESAIVLEPGKEYLVESRLAPLARAARLGGVDEFVSRVRTTGDRTAQWEIVEALTTNETSWFRDARVFRSIADSAVADLVAARAGTRRLRVWSAACSTGQEAYTLAMILHERLPRGWDYEILATDISQKVLDQARKGCYNQLEMNRGLPIPNLLKYFTKSGNHWQIDPELRSHVRFLQYNLVRPTVPLPAFDLVLLRNVLIYFSQDTRSGILHRVAGQMLPSGWLYLGSAESKVDIAPEFRHTLVSGTPAYRPVAGPGPGQTATSRSSSPTVLRKG